MVKARVAFFSAIEQIEWYRGTSKMSEGLMTAVQGEVKSEIKKHGKSNKKRQYEKKEPNQPSTKKQDAEKTFSQKMHIPSTEPKNQPRLHEQAVLFFLLNTLWSRHM